LWTLIPFTAANVRQFGRDRAYPFRDALPRKFRYFRHPKTRPAARRNPHHLRRSFNRGPVLWNRYRKVNRRARLESGDGLNA
jgi:hypothetical protein